MESEQIWNPRRGERGTALVISVIIVTFIVVLVTDASTIARVEWEAATNADHDLHLEYALKSGLQIAEAYLRQDTVDSPDVDHFYEEWSAPGGITKELDPSAYGWSSSSEDGETPFPSLRIIIEDEERKWPLPLVKVGNETEKEQRKERLKTLLDDFRQYTNYDLDSGTASRLADDIVAYISRTEDDEGSFGATPRPLTKSGLPLSTTDLALIPSMPPDILFDILDATSETESVVVPGLINFITLHSDLQVNINTASEAVLRALPRPEDRSVGSDIYQARERMSEDYDTENPEMRVGESVSAGVRDPRDDPRRNNASSNQGEGGEGEEEEGLGYWETVDALRESDIRTLEGRIFDDIRTLVTTQSNVFSIWVEAEMDGVRKIRRYIVRRAGNRFIQILSEPVTYPRFRERTEEERYSDWESDGR